MAGVQKTVLLVLVALIVVSFFMPWISVKSEAVGGITKVLTGKKQSQMASISAFQVPVLANSEESRFMISVIKIFSPNIKDADKKSFLIWVVPSLAVLILAVKSILKNNKWADLTIGIIGCVIFSVAFFKIQTTDLDKLVLKVVIAYGLWITLLAYLGIGLLSLGSFLKLLKSK
jgi:hypothetical protein